MISRNRTVLLGLIALTTGMVIVYYGFSSRGLVKTRFLPNHKVNLIKTGKQQDEDAADIVENIQTTSTDSENAEKPTSFQEELRGQGLLKSPQGPYNIKYKKALNDREERNLINHQDVLQKQKEMFDIERQRFEQERQQLKNELSEHIQKHEAEKQNLLEAVAAKDRDSGVKQDLYHQLEEQQTKLKTAEQQLQEERQKLAAERQQHENEKKQFTELNYHQEQKAKELQLLQQQAQQKQLQLQKQVEEQQRQLQQQVEQVELQKKQLELEKQKLDNARQQMRGWNQSNQQVAQQVGVVKKQVDEEKQRLQAQRSQLQKYHSEQLRSLDTEKQKLAAAQRGVEIEKQKLEELKRQLQEQQQKVMNGEDEDDQDGQADEDDNPEDIDTEEERKIQEDNQRREESQRQEELKRRKDEEDKRHREELKEREEERKRQEQREYQRQKAEQQRKEEAERRNKEEQEEDQGDVVDDGTEVQQREEERRRQEDESKRQAEERRRQIEEENRRREEERKKQEAESRRRAEQRRRELEDESRRRQEERRRREREELRKREEQMKAETRGSLDPAAVRSRFPGISLFMDYKLTRYAEGRDTSKMDPAVAEDIFYDLVTTNHAQCRGRIRMGNSGDGGWDICTSEPYSLKVPCTVYSFGINNDWSFDDAISSQFGCQVRAFDPSMGVGDHHHSDKVAFYNLGLGGKSEVRSNGWKMKTLGTLFRDLGDDDKDLDVLKIDIEYSEWESLKTALQEGSLNRVKQFVFEIHTPEVSLNGRSRASTVKDFVDMYDILYQLEVLGFRKFHNHLNPYGKYMSERTGMERSCCYEMYYINTHYLR